MFDIGWSELVVIAVVALIAIGPKELPGVLRMVGQWMGKARRMAFDFQGQLNEAMREAEMADLKKQFDDVTSAARDLSPTNLLTSMTKDVDDAMKVDLPEPPPLSATSPSSNSSASSSVASSPAPALPEPSVEPAAVAPGEPAASAPSSTSSEPQLSTFTEAEAHALLVEKPADASSGARPDNSVENPVPPSAPATPDVKTP